MNFFLHSVFKKISRDPVQKLHQILVMNKDDEQRTGPGPLTGKRVPWETPSRNFWNTTHLTGTKNKTKFAKSEFTSGRHAFFWCREFPAGESVNPYHSCWVSSQIQCGSSGVPRHSPGRNRVPAADRSSGHFS
jgi:hypothetical protein